MADCSNEIMYYPSEDPANMGQEYNVFDAIPYLRNFCLSKPHVIYHPPTVSQLQAAGAIPVEQLSGLNDRLPTITLSVEVGSCQSKFREVNFAAFSVGFLQPPERGGVDAVAEKLQQCSIATSEQDYWSDEYWGSIQAMGSVSDDSFACNPAFKNKKGKSKRLSMVVTSSTPFCGHDQITSKVNNGSLTTADRRYVDEHNDFQTSFRSSYNNTNNIIGSKAHTSGLPKSFYQAGSKVPRRRDLRPTTNASYSLRKTSWNAEPSVGYKSKLIQRKVVAHPVSSKSTRRVETSKKIEGTGSKGCSASEDTFVRPSLIGNDVFSFGKGKVRRLDKSTDYTIRKGGCNDEIIANFREERKRYCFNTKNFVSKGPKSFSAGMSISLLPSAGPQLRAESGIEEKKVGSPHHSAIFSTKFTGYEDCSTRDAHNRTSDVLEKSGGEVFLQTSGDSVPVDSANIGNKENVPSVIRQEQEGVDSFVSQSGVLSNTLPPTDGGTKLKHYRGFSKNCCTIM